MMLNAGPHRSPTRSGPQSRGARRAASSGSVCERKDAVNGGYMNGYQSSFYQMNPSHALSLGRKMRGAGQSHKLPVGLATIPVSTPSSPSQPTFSLSCLLPPASQGGKITAGSNLAFEGTNLVTAATGDSSCSKHLAGSEHRAIESLLRVYGVRQKADLVPPPRRTSMKEKSSFKQLAEQPRPASSPDGSILRLHREHHSQPNLGDSCTLSQSRSTRWLPSTSTGPPTELRAKLDTMSAPALLALRLNAQNMRGYLEQKHRCAPDALKPPVVSAKARARANAALDDAIRDDVAEISSLRLLRGVLSTAARTSESKKLEFCSKPVSTCFDAGAAELDAWFARVGNALQQGSRRASVVRAVSALVALQTRCRDSFGRLDPATPSSSSSAGRRTSSSPTSASSPSIGDVVAVLDGDLGVGMVRAVQRAARQRLCQLKVEDEEVCSGDSESDGASLGESDLSDQDGLDGSIQALASDVMSKRTNSEKRSSHLSRRQSVSRELSSLGGRRPSRLRDCIEDTRAARLVSTFHRFEEEGEVHRDMLLQSLTVIGFHEPKAEWVQSAFDETTTYCTLNFEEFAKFVRTYEQLQFEASIGAFQEADLDGGGTIDSYELGHVLKSCGITPLKSVCEEMIAEVTQGGTEVDLEGFRKILSLIRDREGFSHQDVARFRRIFERFDHNKSKTMDVYDFCGALKWLGYPVDREQIDRIVLDVAASGKAEVAEHKFMLCLRRVQELEMARVTECLNSLSAQTASKRDVTYDVEQLLRALGHIPCRRAIADAIVDADISDATGLEEISLDELWNFLQEYRKREGFSRQECEEIDAAFKRYDPQQQGSISCLEVGKVLRWLGYHTTWQRQQHIVRGTDVDHSGRLDRQELRKLVRLYREDVLSIMKAAHDEFTDGQSGTLKAKDAEEALRKLGHTEVSAKELMRLFEEAQAKNKGHGNAKDDKGGLTADAFMDVAWTLQQKAREAFRANEGYSSDELAALQRKFSSYDVEKCGIVKNKELHSLLQDLFPELATSAKSRPDFLKMLREVKEQFDGSLNFRDFLRLARQYHDLEERSRHIKESDAIVKSRFSFAEVEELRELFAGKGENAIDCTRSGITLDQLQPVVRRLGALGEKKGEVVSAVFQEIVPEGRLAADFPEFLLIMTKVLNTGDGGTRK